MNNIPEYLAPDYLGGSYLYSDSQSADCIFSYVLSLTMSVDKEVMEKTLNEVLVRFPQFAVKAVKDERSYGFEKNEAPARVYDASLRCSEGGLSTFPDGYLLLVTCVHKTVFIDFHRSLTDEKGAIIFIRSLIFRYLQNSGYEVENDGGVLPVDGSYSRLEAEDAFVKLDDIPASRPVWYMDARSFTIGREPLDTGENRLTQIRIPLSKVKGEAKDCLSVPSAVIPPFFSHVLSEEYAGGISQGQYVVSSIKVNLRHYFPTPTVRPYFIELPLAYNRNMNDYPVVTVLMSQKKLLEAQLRPDALAYSAQQKLGVLDKLDGLQSVGEKIVRTREIFSRKAASATYSFCNVGALIMPESMSRYLTEFYPVIPASVFPVSVSAVTFKGELVVTLNESGEGGSLCRKFVSLLDSHGIPSYISDTYRYKSLQYKP